MKKTTTAKRKAPTASVIARDLEALAKKHGIAPAPGGYTFATSLGPALGKPVRRFAVHSAALDAFFPPTANAKISGLHDPQELDRPKASPKMTERGSAVQDAVEGSDKLTAILSEAIDRLHGRLSPVLRSAAPQASSGAMPADDVSGLANMIRENNTRLQNLYTHVLAITEALDI